MSLRPSRLTLALLATALATSAFAQADKPLRIVVPFAAGGSQDVIARYLGTKLTLKLGFPVIVENKAGAGGIVAADTVAKSTDGATLLMATGGAITVAPHLQKLPYDPKRDLQSVALVADTPMTLAVRSDSPYKTLADVLKDAKARPGQLSYASTGNGSVSHLTGALLAQAAGIEILHVPYRGASPALTDLLGGQVSMIITSAASIDPMVESGKARVLGTFSKNRLDELGHPPTVGGATGLQGMDVPVWVGLMGPTKVPLERADKIVAALLEACRLPETKEQFARIGAVNTCGAAPEMERVVSGDDARWEKVIRTGGIKAE
ncbi:tripartite tricarboxylate transporter substrate binding protein [Xylophilus rhododendri]|uniref:Tripartite tricarboxylate transporter substrate binding protein n=1 Tax=Xylophilus rhododendri TaxID=2697032 RepID=A0A857JDE9_9BURK|nr:tripartite tricarboxylate transporter substrate binding protein [Xylophilus rhododendri]QHJ01232.1 tripartite tricarboxylate transporter substrate binding protein [Xylophilus rhododendri]